MTSLAIIGCGHWGPNLVRNFNANPGADVKIICDLDSTKLLKLRESYPTISTTLNYSDVLASKGVNAVVITTPASKHYQIAKEALLAGKDVLVEKPLTTNIKEAEELVKIAEKYNKILMVGHTFLYNPVIREIRDLLSKDSLGKLYYLQARRTHLGLIREDVNVVWDLAAHDISIFSFLLGEQPKKVSAVGKSYLKKDKIDVAFVTLFYSNNIICNIHVSWIDAVKVREIAIIGSSKRVFFDDLNGLEPLRIYEKGLAIERSYDNFGEFKLLFRDGDIVSPKIASGEPLKLECQHFIHCVETRQSPLTDGINGLNVVKVLNGIDQSLEVNGVLVEIR